MSKRYYIQDTRQCVGNNILLWGSDNNGYTCHLDKAGLYTKEEADRIHAHRTTDVPLLKEDVEAAASLQVDVQRFVNTSEIDTSNEKLKSDFAAYVTGH